MPPRSLSRPLVIGLASVALGFPVALGAVVLLGAIVPGAPEIARMVVGYLAWVLAAAAMIAVLHRVQSRRKDRGR